jgi:hypothetical protein
MTTTVIKGIINRQIKRPTQLFVTSIAAVIGRCHAVIPSGVSPGIKLLRSAISSSAISSFVGSTSSVAIPVSLFSTPKYLGYFFFKKTSFCALIKKRKHGILKTPY